jgi:glyoxylase-like metal-dependent hydrolase (beta-lactamase superfamily II)
VLLPHAHSDHIGGGDLLLLDVVMAYGERLAERPLAVAGPPVIYARLREVIGDSLRLPARNDPRLRWLEQDGGTAFSWASVDVECVTVEHAPDLAAPGYTASTSVAARSPTRATRASRRPSTS